MTTGSIRSRMLDIAHEDCRYLPDKIETYEKEDPHNPDPGLLRLRTRGAFLFNWWVGAKPGDVCTKSVPTIKYNAPHRYHWSNQVYQTIPMYLGTTHVAVGFVDLGTLLCADIRGVEGEGEGAGPLSYVGYEMVAHNVAKSLILWHMMQGEGDIRDVGDMVLQVWFSSSWEPRTEAAFRAAAVAALSALSPDTKGWLDIVAVLRHWIEPANAAPPLARCRELWQAQHELCLCHCLKRPCDRRAVAAYELAGDFAVPPTPAGTECDLVGSMVLYCSPDGTPPGVKDEKVFSCAPFDEVCRECRQAEEAEGAEVSVVTGVERWLRGKVHNLIPRARDGSVTVSLHLGDITDKAVVKSVAAMAPRTMSWSNVLDYIPAKAFHTLAKQCGGKTCTHNGLLDIHHTPMRLKVLTLYRQFQVKVAQETGVLPYLRLPIPEMPVNGASYFLQHMLFHRDVILM
ncbi:hypothetical protein KIPB_004743 [Kipferlia bialata]|uniref:Uncharacterized protein n=1 Tax=Kipferlia bialata TaxID=797122 RepID=A0A9K3CWG2_9EUKA|nr:hypothetical protein KIPB_004743 [Kipferlia bialata]|eukprot:g4743.t1